MSTPSSQGTTCSFNGVALGRVTGFNATGGSAVFAETTNVTSAVVGAGATSRVVKTYDCVAIDPGTVEINLYGCPPYVVSQIGMKATVSIVFSGGSLSKQAFLETFDVSGSVGEFLKGKATFKLTGDSWT